MIRIVTATLLASACMHVAPALAAQSYDNCTGFITALPATIATPGTWCMKQDLATAITSGSAVNITSNNVTVDCNDFRLGGMAAGPGTRTIGIRASDRANVTVRNCAVRGFLKGMELADSGAGTGLSSGHLVERNRLDGNTWLGIDIAGEGGVVRDNRVINTGGATGIANGTKAVGIYTDGEVDIVDNVVNGVFALAGSGGHAVALNPGNTAASSIVGNRVRNVVGDDSGDGGYGYGIRFWGTAGRVVIEGNHLIGPGGAWAVLVTCPASNEVMVTRNVAAGWTYPTFDQCLVQENNLVH